MSMRSGQNLRIELRENNYSPYQLYLTNLQTNTQNNLGFSHALPAAHAFWLNTLVHSLAAKYS